ncbi:MAG: valine--tRNA ligase [Bacteroidales bacterium]|nr:valine--tRNA ligase [Bacteroidales bacterium]
MDIPSKYDPSKTEDKWYKYWLDEGLFRSVPDEREPYTIVIPPPNVTGVLHMGHMLNNTIQDVLIRRKRMEGKNTLWVPGTDHASIATEAKVVAKLREEGIDKYDLSREEFLKHAWEWTHKYGGIILEQLKKLGASCDWNRTNFTMDPHYYESVIKVFIDLHNKGLIYRGVRMVNWDPQAKTAVSDEEVFHREENSKLYHVRYQIKDSDDWITIATTRPETILGDTAVAVNPNDERYTSLHGKQVIIPLVERPVPLITDEYVDMEFGTGALKITPAHDENDYEIGIRHNLESIDILNDDGTLSEAAQFFIGLDRFVARKETIKELERRGQLVKTEDYVNKVGYSERTDAVIEPKLSMQWFLRMKDISKPALENVVNGKVKLHPHKFINTYRHWMENVKDWCISRQLWWGHRIPAWYIQGKNEYVVAANIEGALIEARNRTGNPGLTEKDLKQDEDVLDTWFSSWLWPIAVFDGIRYPENTDYNYYYPTNDLVTAPEILFFWVARMIIAGYEYPGKRPFDNVYLTGTVRDSQRRRMSKSLGNSPNPLDLIKKYSADGVRVGMLLCSPAGGDLLYDDSLPEQGRNFGNKIWNAFRLVKQWKVDQTLAQPEVSRQAVEWFNNKIQEGINQLDDQFKKYRISEALMTVYRLFWDEFSAWYLEAVKPGYQRPMDAKTYTSTIWFLDSMVRLLHPFMPFITEEIWQLLEERESGDTIMNQPFPGTKKFDSAILKGGEQMKEAVTAIRNIRKDKNIPFKEPVHLVVKDINGQYDHHFEPVLKKLGHVDKVDFTSEEIKGVISFRVQSIEFYIPLDGEADHEEELKKLQEELKYTKGFLKTVMKKLDNEHFVSNAPAQVVEKEKQKMEDAEKKIKVLEARISNLQ